MKLSIITINYNNKHGLQKTIDSVISQVYKEFEWIIIDGGSTDGSKELIELYTDYITYWVSEPDKGIYNAMNKGILASHGEYLLFLNSGDYLYNINVLEVIFQKQQYSHDIITANIQKDGKKVCGIGSKKISLLDFMYGTVLHPSTFIKRCLFDRYGLYDEKLTIVSDWKFFIQTLIIGNASIKYVDIIVSVFDNTGISSTNIDLIKKEKELVLHELFPSRILSDYDYLTDVFKMVRNPLMRLVYAVLVKLARYLK